MRKLIRNRSMQDYKDMISTVSPRMNHAKLEMSSTMDSYASYDYLKTKKTFRDFIVDVDNLLCPYCEITTIGKGAMKYEADHIKPRSKYRDLAIAWDNLTPSCGICNGNKGDFEDVLNPITNDFSDIEFFFLPDIENFIKIVIFSKNIKTRASIDRLDLNTLYNNSIPLIKKSIKNLQYSVQGGLDISEYVGYNNFFGRLLESYKEQIEF